LSELPFDPRAHEPLVDAAWDPAAAEAAIRAIARDADEALRGRGEWWPAHPLDGVVEEPGEVDGVYLGAAGMLLALQRLAEAGLHEPGHDYARLAGEVLDAHAGSNPSVWLGRGGIALVAWLLARRPAEVVVSEPGDDTRELLWGSPGQLLIARELGDADATRAIEQRLLPLRVEEDDVLGAAHGFAGVVAALRRDDLLRVVTGALARSAVRAGELANWPPRYGGPLADADGAIRTQWCHGAPGIVCSTAFLPRDGELDALLLAGGELTWVAGPLRKGAGLCHGTAGNGFALLKLFRRTGDELWLDRARRFAMHAAAQVDAARREYGRGRYSLWTGDLGTATYLQQCLAAGPGLLPAIELW
jgi:hypothetical protein